jgi:hypothetical protein
MLALFREHFFFVLFCRAKRMSIEIGPSSYASRKKKSKKDPAS